MRIARKFWEAQQYISAAHSHWFVAFAFTQTPGKPAQMTNMQKIDNINGKVELSLNSPGKTSKSESKSIPQPPSACQVTDAIRITDEENRETAWVG